jgi:hypothetical protein
LMALQPHLPSVGTTHQSECAQPYPFQISSSGSVSEHQIRQDQPSSAWSHLDDDRQKESEVNATA